MHSPLSVSVRPSCVSVFVRVSDGSALAVRSIRLPVSGRFGLDRVIGRFSNVAFVRPEGSLLVPSLSVRVVSRVAVRASAVEYPNVSCRTGNFHGGGDSSSDRSYGARTPDSTGSRERHWSLRTLATPSFRSSSGGRRSCAFDEQAATVGPEPELRRRPRRGFSTGQLTERTGSCGVSRSRRAAPRRVVRRRIETRADSGECALRIPGTPCLPSDCKPMLRGDDSTAVT